MAAIMPSLWKLAENMGLNIKKDTIEEQINAMNKALDQKQENNIANALWNYADASGGGGGGGGGEGFNEYLLVSGFNRSIQGVFFSPDIYMINSSDGVYRPEESVPSDRDRGNSHLIFVSPVKKIVGKYISSSCVGAFTPASDFLGFYYTEGGEEVLDTDIIGDTITPGDGKVYIYYYDYVESKTVIKKTTQTFKYDVE